MIINFLHKKIKNYFSNEIISVSLKNSSQVIIRFFLGLLNIKIISVWLKTAGMAQLGQFSSFIQIAAQFTGAGFQQGIIKLISKYSNSFKRQALVINNSFLLGVFFGVIIGITFFLYPSYFSKLILNTANYSIYIKYSGIIFISQGILNIIINILNGLKDYKSFIRLNIICAVINTAISIPCIFLYKLNGALLAIYLSSILNITIAFLYCRQLILKAIKNIRFSKYITKRLLGFGLMLTVAASINPLISLFTRNLITSSYSIETTGLWEGINRISKSYNNIIISIISLYTIPKISNLEGVLLNQFIKRTLRLILPLLFCSILLIFLLRTTIISILFTSEFSKMKDLFLYQNIGDFIRIFNWFYAINLIIKEKINIYLLSEIGMAIGYSLLLYFLIPIIGAKNCTLPYAINTLVYLIVSQILYRKYIITKKIK